MNMKRKIMGYSVWELGLVLGGGLVVGGMVRMLGLRGAPLYAVGVLAGYVLRGMRPGTGWKEPAQIADLRSKFAHAVPDNGHVRMNGRKHPRRRATPRRPRAAAALWPPPSEGTRRGNRGSSRACAASRVPRSGRCRRAAAMRDRSRSLRDYLPRYSSTLPVYSPLGSKGPGISGMSLSTCTQRL